MEIIGRVSIFPWNIIISPPPSISKQTRRNYAKSEPHIRESARNASSLDLDLDITRLCLFLAFSIRPGGAQKAANASKLTIVAVASEIARRARRKNGSTLDFWTMRKTRENISILQIRD